MSHSECFAPEHLIAEHFAGRYAGLLQIALDFVRRFRLAGGEVTDVRFLEAAEQEGLTEDEVLAAILIEEGNYSPPVALWGTETVVK